MMKRLVIIAVLCVIVAFLLSKWDGTYIFFRPRSGLIPQKPFTQQHARYTSINTDPVVIAENLRIPWDIAFLPSGDMLVTERAGRLLKIGSETKTVAEISGVKHIGEGGLLGIALHPQFLSNSYIYLYSTSEDTTGIINRVERYTLSGDTLIEKRLILGGIRGSVFHDGGRIIFGPDGYLYITTGDAQHSANAQDIQSLNGKILRVKDDGSIPSDNPFGNAVYSLGHRNPQGLAWDQEGRLWQTEHGPSGLQTGYDEVNLIQKGANYGWPLLKGDQKKEGYVSPIVHSGSNDTWAPADLIWFNGALYFSGLRGEAMYKGVIRNDAAVTLSVYNKKTFGRIRAVVLSPDGFFYITTSNTDSRGLKRTGDDRIIRIHPDTFK